MPGNRYADRFFERPGTGPGAADPATTPPVARRPAGDRLAGDRPAAARTAGTAPTDAVESGPSPGAGGQGTDGQATVGRGTGGPTRPGDPGPRPGWHWSAATRLALVAALVVGAAGGAYGLDRWRERETALAARGEVDLVAWSTVNSYSGERSIDVAFRFLNEGDHAVTVRDLHVENPRLESVEPPDPVTIGPGETGEQLVTLEPTCDETTDAILGAGGWGVDPAADPAILVVEVETVDGDVARRTVPAAVGSDVTGMIMYSCAEPAPPSFADSYARLGLLAQDDPDVVRVLITIELLQAPPDVEISDVRTRSQAFVVVGSEIVPESFETETSVSAEIAVGDCRFAELATESDMTIFVDGRLAGSGPGLLLVQPSAALAVALVRLTDSVCG